MAKKKGDDTEFDDGLDDFDDFGDFGDGGFDGPGTRDDRSPVAKVAGGFKEGLTSHIKDPKNQVKFAKAVLPEGYGRAIDGADQALSIASELYDHTLKEVKPVVSATKKLLQMVVPKESMFLPKKWTEALHAALDERDERRQSEDEINEMAISSALGEVFKVQSEQQSAQYQNQEAKADVRAAIQQKGMQSSVEQLLAIRYASEKMLAYQDQVNVNYQKKMLEMTYRSYFVHRRHFDAFQKYAAKVDIQLDAISKNTALPEEVKVNNSEMIGRMLKERMFSSVSDWASGMGQRFLKNAKSEISNFFSEIGGNLQMALFAAESVKDAAQFESGGGHGLAGKTLGGAAAAKLAQLIAKPLRGAIGKNATVKRGNSILNYGLDLFPQFMSDWLGNSSKSFLPESMRHGALGTMEDGLKRLFGGGYKRETEVFKGEGSENLDKATHFRQLTRRTIEEVIPGWLSKIHTELAIIRTGSTDQKQLSYDFDSSKFTTVEQKIGAIKEELNRQYDTNRLYKAALKVVQTITAGSAVKLSATAAKLLQDQIMKNSIAERQFNPLDYVNLHIPGKEKECEEIRDFMMTRFNIREDAKGNPVLNLTPFGENAADQDTLDLLNATNLSVKELIRQQPDVRSLITRYMKAGGADAIRGLGITTQNGASTFLDEEKLMQVMLGRKWRGATADNAEYADDRLAGVYNARKPFRAPGGKGGLEKPPGPNIPGRGNRPMPIITTPPSPDFRDLGDVFEKALKEHEDAVVKAIMENDNKALIQGTNELLAVIIELNKQAMTTVANMQGNGQPGQMHWADRTIHGVLDMGKGIKNFVGREFRKGNILLRKAFRKVKKGFGWMGEQFNKSVDWYNNSDFKDYYLKGRDKVVLLARDIRDGKYFDEDGKVITTLKDIKGAIYDAKGEIVVKAEELKELVSRDGRPLLAQLGGVAKRLWDWAGEKVDFITSPVKSAFNFAKRTAMDIVGYAKAHCDIYVRGEQTPRLYARVIRQRGYISEKTGKPIESFKDIVGTIKDLEGNVVLSAEDFAKGLVDKDGNELRTLGEKALSAAGYIGSKVWEKAVDSYKAGKNLLMKAGKWIKDAWKGLKGETASTFFGSRTVGVLERIYDLLDKRMPGGKRKMSDTDGDGLREGGWQDRIKDEAAQAAIDRQNAQAQNEEKQTGILSKIRDFFIRQEKREVSRDEFAEEARENENRKGLFGWIGGLMSKFGLGPVANLIGTVADKIGNSGVGAFMGNILGKIGEMTIDKIAGGTMNLLGKAGNAILQSRATGAVVNAGIGLAGRAASLGAGAASGLGGMLTGMLGSGAATAATTGTAAAASGGLGAGAIALLTNPVTLAAGAIVLGGIAAYNIYKNLQKSDQYLAKFRIAQYGFDPGTSITDGDDEEIEAIGKLEAMLLPHIVYGAGGAKINPGRVEVRDMLSIFDIDPEDPDEVRPFVAWFAARFRPVFLTHLTVLKDISKGKVKLFDADDKLDTDQRKAMLKRVHFPLDSGPYTVPDNPFPEGMITGFFTDAALDIEPSDIQDYYDDYMEDIEDNRSGDKDKKLGASTSMKDKIAEKPKEEPKGFFGKVGAGILGAGAAVLGVAKSGLLAVKSGFGKLVDFVKGVGETNSAYGGMLASATGIQSPIAKVFMNIAALPVTLSMGAMQAVGILKADTLDLKKEGANLLTKFRMYQYGFSIVNPDAIDKAIALESILMPFVSTGAQTTISDGFSIQSIFDTFEIDQQSDEEVKNFLTWFDGRFKPVFLSHMTVMKQFGATNLHQIDSKIKPEQKEDYLSRVHFTDGKPYAIMVSPIPIPWYKFKIFGANTELEVTLDDVNNIFKKYKGDLKAQADKAKKVATGEDKDLIDKDGLLGRAGQSVKNVLGGAASKAKDFISKTYDAASERLSKIYEDSKKAIADSLAPYMDKLKSAGSFLKGVGSKLISPLTSLGSTIGTAAAKYVAKRGDAKKNEQAMIDEMLAAGITDPKEQAMLMAQVDHESGGFTHIEENLNYRADVLMKISATARNKGLAAVTEAVRQGGPGIAEMMYGGRMGNDQPGDGFKYRGRGFIQLTGKDNYAAASAALGIDLVKNPDLASDPRNAAKIAIWYWKQRVGAVGKSGDVTAVTKKINGGTIGLQDREAHYKGYLAQIQKEGGFKASGTPTVATAASTTGVDKPAAGAMATPSTTPPAAAAPVKPDVVAVKAAPPPSPTAPAKAALTAASPSNVVNVTPYSAPVQTPSVMPVSTGSTAAAAAAKERDVVRTSQMEVQRTTSQANAEASMASVADLLSKQLEVQIDMSLSLRTIAEGIAKLPTGGGSDGNPKNTTVTNRQGGGRQMLPTPADRRPPMGMGRS